MITLLELLEDTVSYYSEDTSRRAVENGLCKYATCDGRNCAVGRKLINPKGLENNLVVPVCGIGKVIELFGKDVFLPQYRHISVSFWRDLQRLHDDKGNWGKNELTNLGKEVVEIIKQRIEAGYYNEDTN